MVWCNHFGTCTAGTSICNVTYNFVSSNATCFVTIIHTVLINVEVTFYYSQDIFLIIHTIIHRTFSYVGLNETHKEKEKALSVSMLRNVAEKEGPSLGRSTYHERGYIHDDKHSSSCRVC